MTDVALATPDDLADLTRLAQAMEAHYEGASALSDADVRRAIEAALFVPAPLALAFVARRGGDAIGFAFVCFIFPGHAFRPGLFLKDVFVDVAARRQGAGRELLRAVAAYADANGFDRIDWTTAVDNSGARALYDDVADLQTDLVLYRLRRQDFGKLLS